MEYVFMVAKAQPHTAGGVATFPADNTGFLQTVLEAQGFEITDRASYEAQAALVGHNLTAETNAEFQPHQGDSDGLANKALAAPPAESSATDAAAPAPDIQDQIEAAHDTPPEDAAS